MSIYRIKGIEIQYYECDVIYDEDDNMVHLEGPCEKDGENYWAKLNFENGLPTDLDLFDQSGDYTETIYF